MVGIEELGLKVGVEEDDLVSTEEAFRRMDWSDV